MYRVAMIPTLEKDHTVLFSNEFKTKEEAIAAHNTVADVLIYLGESRAMPSYANVITLERLDGGEWVEIDEDGFTV